MLRGSSQAKTHPIIYLIIPHFSAIYGPRKELLLEKMTIVFKGKLTLKLFNPKKKYMSKKHLLLLQGFSY